jgi:hypothetical protein
LKEKKKKLVQSEVPRTSRCYPGFGYNTCPYPAFPNGGILGSNFHQIEVLKKALFDVKMIKFCMEMKLFSSALAMGL